VIGLAICGFIVPTVVAAATTAPHETTPHEHLPHTSRALQDIAAFTATFEAPPPKPGSSISRSDVIRVRLANTLPPSDQLSTPVVVTAVTLLLLGCLIHPFRKARRRRHAHHAPEASAEDPPEDPASTTEAATAPSEASAPEGDDDTDEPDALEEFAAKTGSTG